MEKEKGKRSIIEIIRDWIIDADPENPEDIARDFQEGDVPKDYFLIIAHPKTFMDAEKISSHIKKGRAVIINAEKMPGTDKQRLLDFLSGVAMAREGTIARLYQDVFLCSPENVGIIEE